MISIIIPCYNCAKTIIRTLQSLEKQKYQEFEVIVVNDGSTDNTFQVVENYQKNSSMRLILLNKTNSGVSETRNIGLKNCSGELVAFLDSDDIYSEFFLSELYDVLERKQLDISACRFEYVFFSDNKISKNVFCEWKYKNKYELLETQKIKRRTKLNFCCCLYRKKIIDEHHIAFSTDLKYGEDTEFMCKYLFHCEHGGAITERLLYGYTINPKSSMHKMSYDRVQNIEAFKRILNYWRTDSKFDLEVGNYMVDRAVWAVAKDFAAENKQYYDRFCKEYPVSKSMKKMVLKCGELSVKMTAILYLISHDLFFRVIKLVK